MINGIHADIGRKSAAQGVWMGVRIDEFEILGEWCHRNDLRNISEAGEIENENDAYELGVHLGLFLCGGDSRENA
jgi:hypothetical protein